MKITQTKIKEILIIEPDIFIDNRGWFFEPYNKDKLKELGIDVNFVQDNHSFSEKKNTLRGLHFQNEPFAQSKLVYCSQGSALDIIVDLRKKSPTYKQWVSIELEAENKKILFIPKGFAHGFLSLSDNTQLQYKVDNYYNKDSERSIRFDDPDLGIIWGKDSLILSDKDRNAPLLKDCDINFNNSL